YDVGCYPIRFGRLVFGSEAVGGMAAARWAPEGVDDEMQGILEFPGGRRLVFSCGLARTGIQLTRVLGTKGEIRLSGPFHPTSGDILEIHHPGRVVVERVTGPEPSFTPAIRHIHAVLRGEEEPRHLAVDDAMGNARAIDFLYASAREGRPLAFGR
ncbi:MAG: hypothetical protein JOZ41_22685, partial [Chloroflexi bacterium]|nr:hypothetical protein [Chloroflexota bacterium]